MNSADDHFGAARHARFSPGVWRGALALFAFAAMGLLAGAGQPPPRPGTLPPAEAARQGANLVAKILSGRPQQAVTNSGVMEVRDARRRTTRIPVHFETRLSGNSWSSVYEAGPVRVVVIHTDARPNTYRLRSANGETSTLSGNQTMVPFAGSDFWIADLGLEFFHWPQQKVLKHEMRRSRPCRVLESVNPDPSPGAYSRVVSWIDNETSGIVHADAYDFKGRLLKQFDPKEFKKVNGQWQLEEMEIRNTQTGSRTRIDFDLTPPPPER